MGLKKAEALELAEKFKIRGYKKLAWPELKKAVNAKVKKEEKKSKISSLPKATAPNKGDVIAVPETDYASVQKIVDKAVSKVIAVKSKLIDDGSRNRVRKIDEALKHLRRAQQVLY